VYYASKPARLTGVINIPMPRADEATRAFFESILPDDPRVSVRPMFGNVAAFVNGNMFSGVFGNDVLCACPRASARRF
jgi:TfoX/Sxy family transcriptional regulator of competence genes